MLKSACSTQRQPERKESTRLSIQPSLQRPALSQLRGQTAIVHSTGKPSTSEAARSLCGPVYQPRVRYVVCGLELQGRLFSLNHSYVSLRYYEMGFLPMLKETADVSVPL